MPQEKFTREQLHAPYQQMVDEHKKANQAASWLKERLNLEFCSATTGLSWPHGGGITPDPPKPWLKCSSRKKMKDVSWLTESDEIIWPPANQTFEADTPFGQYLVVFENERQKR